MNHLWKTVVLVAFVALLTAGPAFAQSPTIEEENSNTAAAAPVAYVYVQTAKGVNVYDASTAGKLTLVKGSPFATSGQMEGVNGKYLLSVGTTNIRSYPIAPTGAVEKQVSTINTQDYSGSECGSTSNNGYPNGSVLDHTGRYLYVVLYDGYNTDCAAWQSYQVASNGSLHFLGSMEDEGYYYGNPQPSTLPTISSNDELGYAAVVGEGGCNTFSTYVKAPDGQLEENDTFSEAGPEGDPSGAPWYFCPTNASADPDGHLAVLMYSEDDLPYGNYGPLQLASYTITDSSTGSIKSNNTWLDMPIPDIANVSKMDMSPSGKLLAIAGNPGLQLFHFNGAKPITKYSKPLLTAAGIDQLGWDHNNHLYALSYASGKLYVYTVTPTSMSEVAGSPYSVANAYGIKGLIVVPK